MRSSDGAKICKLVGLYLLDKLSKLLENDSVGLYKDDGVAAIKSTSTLTLDKMRIDRMSLFKEEGQTITIDTNLIEIDFLDETFNLATGKLFLFRKPNNVTLYINVKSNHLSTIIKDLPKMINKSFLSYLVTKMSSIKQNSYTKIIGRKCV